MRCPVCLTQDSKVNDSRIVEEGFAVRRRRECQKCGFRFSTFEQIEILNLMVIKRNGQAQAYQREKIEQGLRRALEKRAYTQENFKRLINNIERDIQRQGKDEITTAQIGEIVMKRLKTFDKIAYIRFASVYRSFEDIKSFREGLDDLINGAVKRKIKKKK